MLATMEDRKLFRTSLLPSRSLKRFEIDQSGRGVIKAEFLSVYLPRGKINEHPQ